MSTSTRIAYFKFTEHHSGAFSGHGMVDLNREGILQSPRTPFWCTFLSCECRPQQGLHTSNSQNTILNNVFIIRMSTSTRIAYFKFTEHQSGSFSGHGMVDLNRDRILQSTTKCSKCATVVKNKTSILKRWSKVCNCCQMYVFRLCKVCNCCQK